MYHMLIYVRSVSGRLVIRLLQARTDTNTRLHTVHVHLISHRLIHTVHMHSTCTIRGNPHNKGLSLLYKCQDVDGTGVYIISTTKYHWHVSHTYMYIPVCNLVHVVCKYVLKL